MNYISVPEVVNFTIWVKGFIDIIVINSIYFTVLFYYFGRRERCQWIYYFSFFSQFFYFCISAPPIWQRVWHSHIHVWQYDSYSARDNSNFFFSLGIPIILLKTFCLAVFKMTLTRDGRQICRTTTD